MNDPVWMWQVSCKVMNTIFPQAKCQRCTVHLYRNVMSAVPRGKMKLVATMLKAIHAQGDRQAARAKVNIEDFADETLEYNSIPTRILA